MDVSKKSLSVINIMNFVRLNPDSSQLSSVSMVEPNKIPLMPPIKDIPSMHGKCGIMTVCLIDPLSQLINKISGNKDTDVNAVGLYYESELHGVKNCTVILFNTYDNAPVPWLRLGYTMDLLLASPFVTKITYYPIVTHESDIPGPLLSKNNMSIRSGRKRIEETFRTVVIQMIGNNARSILDKNISYTTLLLKIAGITGEEADRLTNTVVTGYSLINKVLLSLMGIEKADPVKINSSIIPCPLLKQPITISAPQEPSNETDIKYIIEESRREITKLAAVFVDLFTTHDGFRTNVLNTHMKKSGHTNLDNLFTFETELITHVVGGLHNGIISNSSLNEVIQNLMSERFQLGNYQRLSMSVNPQSTIHVTNDNMICTFQQPSILFDNDPLRDIGAYISHITESFSNSEILTIDLGGLISAYNNTVAGTKINKILVPYIGGNHTLSRSAIVTIPGDPNSEHIKIPTDTKTIAIPMYNGNLTSLTESQLTDILVYIDSLRTNDGSGDTRFSNLQNEIIHELARRRRLRTSKKS